jgi:hypothetical protein
MLHPLVTRMRNATRFSGDLSGLPNGNAGRPQTLTNGRTRRHPMEEIGLSGFQLAGSPIMRTVGGVGGAWHCLRNYFHSLNAKQAAGSSSRGSRYHSSTIVEVGQLPESAMPPPWLLYPDPCIYPDQCSVYFPRVWTGSYGCAKIGSNGEGGGEVVPFGILLDYSFTLGGTTPDQKIKEACGAVHQGAPRDKINDELAFKCKEKIERVERVEIPHYQSKDFAHWVSAFETALEVDKETFKEFSENSRVRNMLWPDRATTRKHCPPHIMANSLRVPMLLCRTRPTADTRSRKPGRKQLVTVCQPAGGGLMPSKCICKPVHTIIRAYATSARGSGRPWCAAISQVGLGMLLRQHILVQHPSAALAM